MVRKMFSPHKSYWRIFKSVVNLKNNSVLMLDYSSAYCNFCVCGLSNIGQSKGFFKFFIKEHVYKKKVSKPAVNEHSWRADHWDLFGGMTIEDDLAWGWCTNYLPINTRTSMQMPILVILIWNLHRCHVFHR